MKMVDNLLEGKLLLRIREKIERKLGVLARIVLFSHGAVDEKKIFFMTFDSSYTCNPSYIADEIVRRNLPVQLVFVRPGKGEMIGFSRVPECVKLVKRGTAEMFREQASSKIWIDNALNCLWYHIPKKKNQIYINTWHGSMGIKRLSGNDHWLKIASKCDKTTDYIITNSTFEEGVFRESFWPSTKLLQYGHPRNDILFDHSASEKLAASVREFFQIEGDKKLLLYAPTFRDSGNTRCYNVDYGRLKAALDKRFGGDWVILVRMHFKNRSISKRLKQSDWLINATAYPDMQELIVASDAGLTDYSSWAYDFVLTGRPLFLYTPDLADYDQDRGFCYDIDTTPFPRSETNDALVASVENFDEKLYHENVQRFLDERGCYEHGDAASRVVDKIQELLQI